MAHTRRPRSTDAPTPNHLDHAADPVAPDPASRPASLSTGWRGVYLLLDVALPDAEPTVAGEGGDRL